MEREYGKVHLGMGIEAGSFEAEQAILANAGLPPLVAKPSESIPLAAEIVRGVVVAGVAVIAGAAIIAAAAPAAVAGAGATAAAGELAGAGAIAGATAAPAAAAGAGATAAAVAGAGAAGTGLTVAGVAGTVATVAGVAGTAAGVGEQLGLLPGHTSAPPTTPLSTETGGLVKPPPTPSTAEPLTFWSWLASLFGSR
jgi:hypothetical protein